MSHRGLLTAISDCRVRQIKVLMNLGARLTPENGKPKTSGFLLRALRIEDRNKRRIMFRFLLKHGADYNEVDRICGRDVLTWACYLRRETQVRDLLDNCL